MKKMLDTAIRNWGFENSGTIHLARMIENKESYMACKKFIQFWNHYLFEE